ncbi:MAG: SapC family protein, partial [Pseudomonadota bacterium]
MASTPENGAAAPEQQAAQLPLFYKSLVPLSSQQHAKFGVDVRKTLEFTRGMHAIPLTVDEFASAQRHYPIIFSGGETPAPLALLGLQEGQNFFLNEDGTWREETYVPAYIRRYPFMLARLRPDSDDLSLCFDNSYDEVHEDAEQPFFDGTETT